MDDFLVRPGVEQVQMQRLDGLRREESGVCQQREKTEKAVRAKAAGK